MLLSAASFFITVPLGGKVGPLASSVIFGTLGVILFLRGFRMLRYKQLILNTPFSKIRSASMGLVEVSGAAKGPRTIPAGITGQACYYYCAVAFQLRQSGKDRSWQQVASECLSVPFFVEDPTGRLLVDSQGASLDVERNFKDEFDTSFFSNNRDMLPENVAKFLNRNNIKFNACTRVEEHCIKPDSSLFVFGTLSPNSPAAQWTPNVHAPAATLQPTIEFNFAGGGTKRPLLSFGVSAISTVDPEVTKSFVVAAIAQSAPSQAPKPAAAAWSSISMDDENIASGNPSAAARTAAPVPQTSAVATADTDDAAPDDASPVVAGAPACAGFDLCPPAVIRKGARGEPFMISTRSQREVVRSLAWKSALCIWGGPVLTLINLFLLVLTLELM
jgi:hypothetical protein